MRHFLEVDDLTRDELASVLALAAEPVAPRVLEGMGAALVFEKPSARTRNSMEMAVHQLGGHPVYIEGHEIGMDTRETVEDVTRTLACYHGVLAARVFDHGFVERMAALDVVPIVNLLSDVSHPMQALADLLTMAQELGGLEGRTVAFVGDGNNVFRSLAIGAAMSGMDVRIAAPAGYTPPEIDLDRIRAAGADPMVTQTPAEAVKGADVVYTDVWTSMGQEEEAAARRDAFSEYTVDDALMTHADPGGIFLHCLPAHRGEEVAASVADGDRSRIWRQAENRMHSARGLLAWLLAT